MGPFSPKDMEDMLVSMNRLARAVYCPDYVPPKETPKEEKDNAVN